jgi:nucleoside-diphosphate-sugar epimerase
MLKAGSPKMKKTILLIGSNGQIGSELAAALREIHGIDQVVSSDIRIPQNLPEGVRFEQIDVLDKESLHQLFTKVKPDHVYLLAAMLSATGEKFPRQAWDLNMNGLFNVFDLCLEFEVKQVFWPSSIAVFGPNSPRKSTPQHTVMDPNTVYGISKLAGERYCEYYFNRYGLDVRSIRYPGIISWKTPPGGGTTDYAIQIFHDALEKGTYESFLSAQTELPMLYMEDAIKATLQLMDAPAENIHIRSSYNLTGVSFTPEQLAQAIQKQLPSFTISYAKEDPRQAIADSWPGSIDDSVAQKDWGWKPSYTMDEMVEDMLKNLKK